MCGIAGFINLEKNTIEISEQILDKMQQSISHRGPDDYRIFKSDEHQIGLIQRRLKIIDLTEKAAQPMFTIDKNIVVCFNGEIYNYKELRKDLESLNYNFFSTSDTETILYAYKEWGIDFINKISGMFAIVIYDFKKRELYLIRDRIGVKPIYFYLQ